ncbi:O-antigen ligase [Herbaspirillum sp. CAH-3]|uniref:O-antigen ligase family protein n=1 Tax=Herbaspirillum sp. CAH-3 TaxID=2605746 RepID=UPI0012ACB024|nr:O-antigen ligase family protein [Herbaspirillum sp. CAH-3]MRT27580.1 O-antigen ligase family protein [Herbaspirillum sp. CAH-3]
MKKIDLDSSQLLVLGAAVMVAVVVGMALPVVAALLGDSYARLAALPVLFLLGGVFLFNKRLLLLMVLLLRASGDIVLEATRVGATGASTGLGGAINALVILIALLLFIERPRLLPRKAAVVWLILIAVEAVGVVVTPVPSFGVKMALAFCSYFAVFVCAFYTVRTQDDFRFMVRIIVGSSVIPVIYGLISIALKGAGGISTLRVQSTFTHPNIFAFYLTLVISLGLYVLKSSTFKLSSIQRVSFTAYVGLLAVMLLLTQTRSAWLACFLLFVLYGALFERRYLVYILVLCCLAMLIPSVQQRIMDLDAGNSMANYAKLNSFAWRVLLWDSALKWMSASRYFTGYGVEAFGFYAPLFFPMAGNTEWSAHNVYVQLFFDVGLLGLLAYFAVFYQCFRALLKYYKRDRLAAGILMCALVQYLVVSASDNMLGYLAFNWYFWTAMGMGWSLCSNLERQEKVGIQKSIGPATAPLTPA